MHAQNIIIEEKPSQSSDTQQPSKPFDIYGLQQQKLIIYKISSWKSQSSEKLLYIQLKDLFMANFPKMDQLDIIRIIKDGQNKNLFMLMNGQILAGACFRMYKQQKLATISLLAVDQAYNMKGFGSRLLDILKNYLQGQKINSILTYADYLAILFFKKQGFSTEVTIEKRLCRNLITKNLGAVLMQCQVSQSINYEQKKRHMKAYRKFIESRSKKICIQKVFLKGNLQALIKIKRFFSSTNSNLLAQTVSKFPGFQEFQRLNNQSKLQQVESKISIQKQCMGLVLELRSHPSVLIFKNKKQFYDGIDNTNRIFQIVQKLNSDKYENFQEFATDITTFMLSLSQVSKNTKQFKHAQLLQTQFRQKIKNLRHLNKILLKKGIHFKQVSNQELPHPAQ